MMSNCDITNSAHQMPKWPPYATDEWKPPHEIFSIFYVRHWFLLELLIFVCLHGFQRKFFHSASLLVFTRRFFCCNNFAFALGAMTSQKSCFPNRTALPL